MPDRPPDRLRGVCALLAALRQAGALVFALLLGMLWLTTVPLTNGLIGDIFGTAYASTLFGVVFASHQLGSFFGRRGALPLRLHATSGAEYSKPHARRRSPRL